MEVPRLKLPLKTRRDWDEAKRALVLLARGDGAVRNVLVGPVSDIFDCESVMTLLAMIYSVLVPGGTIDIGAHPRLLPLCAEEIRAGHLERSPPGARHSSRRPPATGRRRILPAAGSAGFSGAAACSCWM